MQLALVRAEIIACGASGTPMPVERRREFEDCLEGLCIAAQPYWEKFTPEDRETVLRARARVVRMGPVPRYDNL